MKKNYEVEFTVDDAIELIETAKANTEAAMAAGKQHAWECEEDVLTDFNRQRLEAIVYRKDLDRSVNEVEEYLKGQVISPAHQKQIIEALDGVYDPKSLSQYMYEEWDLKKRVAFILTLMYGENYGSRFRTADDIADDLKGMIEMA